MNQHQAKERQMQKLEARIDPSVAEAAGASKPRKSQSLRLDKQIIRTLTGAELSLAGGGAATTATRGCTPCKSTRTVP
jgi:hypothetical protein